MDYQIPILFSSTIFFLLLLKLLFPRPKKLSKLPPGPNPWPIIGNLFQLSANPHRALAHLSNKYGPLMTLKLGSITTIVVSSADMAREVLLKHDQSLSGRIIPPFVHVFDHHQKSILWLPVSSKWRTLKKVCVIELFTKKSLDATSQMRHEKVQDLRKHVEECCRKGEAVEIHRVAFTTLLNLQSNTFFSTDFVSQSSAASEEFRGVVLDIIRSWGKARVSNFFPSFACFDLLGSDRRKLEASILDLFSVFDDMIQQNLSADASSRADKGDVLTTMLNIGERDGVEFSHDEIKHFLMDMFLAGTDTSASIIEWALTELLCNPSKMEKVQAELDQILGKNYNTLVCESDIDRLPYLQAVFKETLRLHPTGPLLAPHKAEKDVDMCGYTIPSGSQVLVNVWAISRDPNLWSSPTVFCPERFLESEIDFKGQDFRFLPFGSGRRMCPAIPFASRMLELILANLLHQFKWKLEDGVRIEDVDFTEKVGLSVQKVKPLLSVPVLK